MCVRTPPKLVGEKGAKELRTSPAAPARGYVHKVCPPYFPKKAPQRDPKQLGKHNETSCPQNKDSQEFRDALTKGMMGLIHDKSSTSACLRNSHLFR